MATIVDLLIGLGIDAEQFAGGIDQAVSKTDNFVNNVTGKVGPAIAGAFAIGGAAAVGFAATSVNAAGDFEAAVNNLAAVSGSALADAGFSFDDVSAKALELGQTTAFSASQSIAAMTELVKGGVPIVDVMGDATAATLDLAAAGQVELATAAEIVSKQLGVWSETGITATETADLLASAANASTVGVEELALGLSNVNGTAKTAGVEFEDLVQTMALIAPQFSSAADAGTSLKTMISRLIPTSDSAYQAASDLGLAYTDWKAAAEELGISLSETVTQTDAQAAVGARLAAELGPAAATTGELGEAMAALAEDFSANAFYDAQGNFLGMENAARMLHEATKDLSEEEKLLAFNTIFGSDAIRAAAAVANAGAEGFGAMGESMAAAGTAAEVAAIQNQGFNFALDSMLGAVETLQIVVGTLLLPVLTAFINDNIIPGIAAVTGFAQSIFKAADPIFAITNALYAFSPLLGDLIGYLLVAIVEGDRFNDFFANLPAPVQMVITALTALVDLIGGNLTPILIGVAAVAGGIVVLAIGSMIASFLAVAAPIALAVAAAAAMYAAYNENFLGIQTVVNSVVSGIASIISSVMSTVLSFWQANGASIMSSASTAWTTIQTQITNAVTAVNAVITAIMGVVLTFWQNNGAQIMASAASIWAQIQGIVTTVVTLLSTIITNVFNFIAGFINEHGAEIQNIFTTAWNFIEGIVTNALTVIQGIINMVLGIITGDMETFDKGAQQVFEGLFGALETIVTDGVDLVQGLITGAIDFILEALGALVDDGSGLGQDFMQGVADGITAGIDWIVDAAQNAAQSALDAAKALLGISSPSRVAYAEWGVPFMQGPINAIYDMLPALETAVGAAVGVFTNGGVSIPDVSASAGGTDPAGIASLGAAGESFGPAVIQNYDIDAHYTSVEDETTLRDTVRRHSILNAPRGA